MKNCISNLKRSSLIAAVLFVLYLPAQLGAQALRFQIKVAPEVSSAPVSGRMIVFLSAQEKPQSELGPGFAEDARKVWIAAQEFHDIKPGDTVEINPDEIAFPKPLSQAPAGNYQAMAVLDVNHDYAYAGNTPGDLRSDVIPVRDLNPANT